MHAAQRRQPGIGRYCPRGAHGIVLVSCVCTHYFFMSTDPCSVYMGVGIRNRIRFRIGT
jgi:hypothetical protein